MFFADKVMVSTPFLFTVIVYALVFPSSAVTVTFIVLLPTFNVLLPVTLILAYVLLLLAFTVILLVAFGTVKVYAVVLLLKAGEIVYPVTLKLLRLASFDFLCTFTLYVFVLPLCDVTTIFKVLSPTFNVLLPVPVSVATLLVVAAATVVDVTLFATVQV